MAEVDLTADHVLHVALTTGLIEKLETIDRGDGEILYHRKTTKDGLLVLTPLPASGQIRVPVGKGEIVRFEMRIWSKPTEWPTLREVEIQSAR